MKVWVRNLTKNKDMEIELPMDERKLNEVICRDDEYIVIDSEILDVDQYASIHGLNSFLFDCKENGISLDDLEVLSKVLLYHEVIETVDNQSYCIIDFDAETSGWLNGYGGDITNDFEKGMCLYDSGLYNPFNFKMSDAIHCWIDWEAVWRNANTEGWQAVSINGHGYLVHR